MAEVIRRYIVCRGHGCSFREKGRCHNNSSRDHLSLEEIIRRSRTREERRLLGTRCNVELAKNSNEVSRPFLREELLHEDSFHPHAQTMGHNWIANVGTPVRCRGCARRTGRFLASVRNKRIQLGIPRSIESPAQIHRTQ